MAVTEKDLLAEALERIVEQMRGKTDFGALLSLFTEQASSSQSSILGILNDTNIQLSDGAQLDGIGEIVGEERFARNDVVYRSAILSRIRINLSTGTTEDVISILKAILGPTFTIKIDEYFPASFIATVVEPIDPLLIDPANVAALMRSGRPAGVGSDLIFSVANPFQYDIGLGYDDGAYANAF